MVMMSMIIARCDTLVSIPTGRWAQVSKCRCTRFLISEDRMKKARYAILHIHIMNWIHLIQLERVSLISITCATIAFLVPSLWLHYLVALVLFPFVLIIFLLFHFISTIFFVMLCLFYLGETQNIFSPSSSFSLREMFS